MFYGTNSIPQNILGYFPHPTCKVCNDSGNAPFWKGDKVGGGSMVT